jgi:hypothetical protein
MSRQKLYYTAAEIETGLYTNGGELQYDTGVEFRGQYHRYTTGEYYSGANWNKKTSKKLVPIPPQIDPEVILYNKLNPGLKTKYKLVRPIPVTITDDNIKAGYVRRFLFCKINDNQIIEVDRTQYDQWQAGDIDNNIYSAITIKWYITGPLESKTIDGVLQEGVIDKNNRVRLLLQADYPAVADYLYNPTQYYVDTLIKVAVDINGLDS